MSGSIRLSLDSAVATITIDRPSQHNAISYEMWAALRDTARSVAENVDVRVVVLTGAGTKAFSAGADIKDFPAHRSSTDLAKEYAVAFEGALDAIETIPKPVIAMIKGICVGGGCELSTACDLRIASDNSTFGIPIAKIGVLAGYGELRRLINVVGIGAAVKMLMTAQIFDAQEALRLGLIGDVVPEHELVTYVYTLAKRMAEFAPMTQSGHKELIRTLISKPGLNDLTERERALPLSIFDTDDAQEGYRAFVDKRPPRFTGS